MKKTLESTHYANLYKMNLVLTVGKTVLKISSSDIISMCIMNNYDTMTYPMIRFRLYSDISVIRSLNDNPSDIFVRCNMDGGVYLLQDEKSPSIVKPTKSISLSMKGFIENKNIQTNTYDEYVDGIKKTTNLNDNIKVPIELYCYHDDTVAKLQSHAKSIYTDLTIETVINDLFNKCDIFEYKIDKIHNQEKHEQILFPNLTIIEALSMLDNFYGIYKKGSQLYCDYNNIVQISDIDVNTNKKTIPIYVTGYNNQNIVHGLKKDGDIFNITTSAECVSVVSETDIEKALNPETITSLNAQTLELTSRKLTRVYGTNEDAHLNEIIGNPYLHKSKNKYVADIVAARINEHISTINISLTGADLSLFTIDARINVIFETAIRGMKINDRYRQVKNTHVLSQLDSDLFYAQSTIVVSTN